MTFAFVIGQVDSATVDQRLTLAHRSLLPLELVKDVACNHRRHPEKQQNDDVDCRRVRIAFRIVALHLFESNRRGLRYPRAQNCDAEPVSPDAQD